MIFSRLQRITRDGHWIPEIDGLRFIAILAVVLYHLGNELSPRIGLAPTGVFFSPIFHGLRGVQLFFTISGLVLALPFARQHLANGNAVELRKYYLRRLTRIEPPYIIALALSSLFYATYSHAWSTALLHGTVSALYLHSLIFGNASLVNGAYWSLEVEVQFYLVAPLLMCIFRLRVFAARLACYCTLAAISYAAEIFFRSPRIDLSLPSSLVFFVMGLLAADIYVSNSSRLSAILSDIAGVGALAALFALSNPNAFWFAPICTLLLCLTALRGRWLRRALSTPWIAVTGGMCYSIYLLHLKLMEFVLFFTGRCLFPHASYTVNFLLQLVLVGLPVFALSAIFYRYAERPFMDQKWPAKLWQAITKRRRPEIKHSTPAAFN